MISNTKIIAWTTIISEQIHKLLYWNERYISIYRIKPSYLAKTKTKKRWRFFLELCINKNSHKKWAKTEEEDDDNDEDKAPYLIKVLSTLQ